MSHMEGKGTIKWSTVNYHACIRLHHVRVVARDPPTSWSFWLFMCKEMTVWQRYNLPCCTMGLPYQYCQLLLFLYICRARSRPLLPPPPLPTVLDPAVKIASIGDGSKSSSMLSSQLFLVPLDADVAQMWFTSTQQRSSALWLLFIARIFLCSRCLLVWLFLCNCILEYTFWINSSPFVLVWGMIIIQQLSRGKWVWIKRLFLQIEAGMGTKIGNMI
jgi:hypothetical protein